jgi:hypothetical protein
MGFGLWIYLFYYLSPLQLKPQLNTLENPWWHICLLPVGEMNLITLHFTVVLSNAFKPMSKTIVVIVLSIALLEQCHNRFPSGSPAWMLLVQVLVVMLIYGRSLPFTHLEEMTGFKIPDCVGKAHLRILHHSEKFSYSSSAILGFIAVNSATVGSINSTFT